MCCGKQLARILPTESGGSLAAPDVRVAELFQSAVSLPAVGHNCRARFNVIGHEPVQRRRRSVGERRDPAPAHTFRFPNLDSYTGQDLFARSPAAAQARLHTADVRFIHLHHPAQPVPAWTHQHRTQPMQHRPCRLVGTDLQRALQAQRGNPILAAGEQPAGVEPNRQRRSRAVENCACGHRVAVPAPGAHQPTVAQAPRSVVAANQAREARRPPQPLQIVQAVLVAPEPSLELANGSRIVRTGARVVHRPSLQDGLRLNGYPKAPLFGDPDYSESTSCRWWESRSFNVLRGTAVFDIPE